ncbi:phospholipase B1, membrane-associated isoform X1 [Brienomyrus brachyistius]|uniref:phospholipase B1, membrane-associated isoform X1 n=1 Tax=Brienomyrus brachyistius TaxID=42636 RepID=UPI0020B378A0|nr:phospholipase B1, membrane-associated isoform X1 [Brienomyrus brachyistius]
MHATLVTEYLYMYCRWLCHLHSSFTFSLASSLQPETGETNGLSAWETEETDSLLALLCAQPAPSLSPPSSAHAVRPSDVTVLSAIGLPSSSRSEVLTVLKRISELLSLCNPSLVSLIPEQSDALFSEYPQRSLPSQAAHLSLSLKTHQAIDSDRSWKLVLLLVPVDDLCGCPEQASSQVATVVHQFDQALQTLHGQLVRTVVNAMVWVGHGGVGDSQKERECHCKETSNAAELSLTKGILALSLQESLKHHLEVNPWYNDGEDFAVLLQETPMDMGVGHISGGRTPLYGQRTVKINKVATQLWTNLLQPMTGESDLDNHNLISDPCHSEYQPFLRTQRNSPPEPHPRARTADSVVFPDQKTGSELTCEDRSPSPLTPTSVHALRPADIKVLAALGDSLTAANGAGGSPNNILDVLVEYRGLSWSIGGDENLTSVTTLPNIFREFNPNLTGFAVGTGKEDSPSAFLNQAVAGANSDDMVSQVRVLVEKMRNDPRIDFENDWKVITMFIGGNDLCDHCTDTVYFSPNNFVSHVRQALDILHQEVPRALVNLVEVLNIIPLRRLHQDKSLNCPTWLVNMLCRCVVKPPDGSAEVQELKDLNRAYQSGMQELVESGRYDTHSNFTVVVQPFFREVMLPLLEDGRPDRSFFASDCFHLSQKSHSLMARALWNNMLESLGNKTYIHDFTNDLPLKCPSQASPFLRTYKNSNHSYGDPAPTMPPITNWGSDFSCAVHGPSDPVPSSVHRLRPTDIKVVAALGDSLSAGFGAKAKNLLQLTNEYRGVSWSIGGDQTLETVTTLPNILRKFNPSLRGFSTGIGTAQRGFNMAVSGAKAFNIPAQVEKLIQALRDSKEVDFENDWKLVTLFIGGNDLCQYCQDRASLSPQNYSLYLMESLDLLYRNVPRVLVNVLEILQIDGLRKIKRNSLGCSLLQENLCPCVLAPGEDSLELSEMRRINREFQASSGELESVRGVRK